MKSVLATWVALICVVIFIVVWMTVNSSLIGLGVRFDPSPWIKLNLALSCFAALQCFVLLIANKRGEQIAAEMAQHTLENTEALKTLIAQNTGLTQKVADLTQVVHDHVMAGTA